MKWVRRKRAGAFTLIEVMVSLAIFGVVLAAIYSTWSAILRSSKSGLEFAAQVQRERIAVRTLEQSLKSARSFEADVRHYSFVAEGGSEPTLSFVARLPASFPRSGRFGDFDVRRLTFSIESGADYDRQLVLRQNPILMDVDSDEREHPLVLARHVQDFLIECWDSQVGGWVDGWKLTNQLPRMVKFTLRLGLSNGRNTDAQSSAQEVTRVIALPSIMVPMSWQVPRLQPGQPPQPVPPPQPGQGQPPVMLQR